jgi:hypothetical protein
MVAICSGLSDCGEGAGLATPFSSLVPRVSFQNCRATSGLLPPGALVNGVMKRPVMDATERHREFVAGLAAERTWLHEPKVVRVARLAAKQRRQVCRATNRIMFAVAGAARCSDRCRSHPACVHQAVAAR